MTTGRAPDRAVKRAIDVADAPVKVAPTNITSSWEELGESFFEEQRPTLTMDGEPAQLVFDQVFYLVTKNNWGVYT